MTELHPSTVGVLPTQFHTQKEQQQQKKKKKKRKKKKKKKELHEFSSSYQMECYA